MRIRAPYGFSYADVDSAEAQIKALIGDLLSSSQSTLVIISLQCITLKQCYCGPLKTT